MGPRYSSDGAVAYAITHFHVNKIVFDCVNEPETGYIFAGVKAIAGAAHVPITTITTNTPVTNGSSLALSLVQQAGPDGAVVLNLNPPDDATILQAAQKLGIEDHIKEWGASSPADTDFLAKALGAKWNHKLFVNTEVQTPDDHNQPEMQLYKGILAKYGHAVSGGIGAFSEFGYLDASMFVQAIKDLKPPYTLQRVNQAIVGLKKVSNTMLCQPWSYGKLSLHIPNNEDPTGTPENGKIVTVQACGKIPDADPQIAQYRRVAATAGLG
jgi:branched-chain amino acid transport system substrate-binding protein